MMTTTDDTFRVWVGCLACYNDGRLVGDWHDADTAGDITPADIHGHPTTHEELWCFDIEHAPEGYRREMSPMEAQSVAERLEEIGDDSDAFAAWCANNGETITDADLDTFRDQYAGQWDTFKDYAYELAEECMFHVSAGRYSDPIKLPDDHPLVTYFDHEKWSRDLILSGDYWTHDTPDGVYVFRSY